MGSPFKGVMLGVGSPVVDLLAQVNDSFIEGIHGEKGGMELVSSEVMEEIVGKIDGTRVRAAGGSAGNTTFALARLGAKCAFVGKLGKDEDGDYYLKSFEECGGDISRFKFTMDQSTARCVSLITPDSERTMRTDLGAALLLSPDEITVDDFAGISLVHVEGYLLFNPDLANKVLSCAKEAGCKVSLDLGSFEVVHAAESMLQSLLEHYVDYVFANEEEARAYTGVDDPLASLEKLSTLCSVAAVKIGAEGAWVKSSEGSPIRIMPSKAQTVVDTTGAGDYWAAGFLYGVLKDLSLQQCGDIGSVLGAQVVQQIGAALPDQVWEQIQAEIEKIECGG